LLLSESQELLVVSAILPATSAPGRPRRRDPSGRRTSSCTSQTISEEKPSTAIGGRRTRLPTSIGLPTDGMRFTRAYSTALCTPSRVQLLTGQYNFRKYDSFGYFDTNLRTIGNYLQPPDTPPQWREMAVRRQLSDSAPDRLQRSI
jgi:hypothetical protein